MRLAIDASDGRDETSVWKRMRSERTFLITRTRRSNRARRKKAETACSVDESCMADARSSSESTHSVIPRTTSDKSKRFHANEM